MTFLEGFYFMEERVYMLELFFIYFNWTSPIPRVRAVVELRREMICLQHFYNIFTTNPKWQVVTSCYCWGKKVILMLVSNLNQ